MEITKEYLQGKLAKMQQGLEQERANFHAMEGAIALIEAMLIDIDQEAKE